MHCGTALPANACTTLGRPLVEVRFAGCHGAVNPGHRSARQRCSTAAGLNRAVRRNHFSIPAKQFGNEHRLKPLGSSGRGHRPPKPTVQPVVGTYCYQLGYFPMASPVNLAIYALGGFMLFALAIGFFAAPV